MSPASGPVLGSAVLVSSPALFSALTGALPLDVALTRLLIAVGLCWLALTVVAALVLPGTAPARASAPATDEQPVAGPPS